MATINDIGEVRALRAIAGRLEMELRTAHAFMAMMVLAQGGSIAVPESVSESLPDDFEINVTRDEHVATFTVLTGAAATMARAIRDSEPLVV